MKTNCIIHCIHVTYCESNTALSPETIVGRGGERGRGKEGEERERGIERERERKRERGREREGEGEERKRGIGSELGREMRGG